MKRPSFAVISVLLPLLALTGVVLAWGLSSPTAGAQASSPFFGQLTWGTDMVVNPTPIATPSNRKNHALAISPTNPNFVIGGYDDGDAGTGFYLSSGYAYSSNGGQTWGGGPFPGRWPGGFLPFGDVHVTFDGHGTGYLSSRTLSETTGIYSYMVVTTTNGSAWSTPVPMGTFNNIEYHDFTTLAVDPRTSGPNAGSVYVFWLLNNGMEPFWQGTWGRYSRDGGRTWSGDVAVSDPGHNIVYGTSSRVGSDGTVYLAWTHIPDNNIFSPPEMYLARSTDGGVTWGSDRLISGAPIQQVGGHDYKYRELVLTVPTATDCSYLRINHFPSIGVSPTNPNVVYATWNDSRWEPQFSACDTSGKNSDIAFSRSTDGGLTWSAVVRVNDDTQGNGIDQFMPALGVAPDGTVGISWMDRRYSTGNNFYDVAYSQSTDGGLTWSPNQRVSDMSSNPDNLKDIKFIDDVGARHAVVLGPNYALTSWVDTRLGNSQGDFFADRGTAAGATATATGSTATRTPLRTASPSRTAGVTSTAGTITAVPTSTVASPSVTATPGGCTLQFTDVPPDNTFYSFVRCLACQGYINGYPCGNPEPCDPENNPYFRPNNNITRGQLSKIVSNAAGFTEPVSGQTFEDVPPGSTFYEFVERVASREIIQGYACGNPEPCVGPDNRPYFRPNNNATRGQISKIVSNARGLTDPPGAQIFEDVPPGSTFFDFIQRLASRGYMSGYPCGSPEPCVPPDNRPYFRPNNNATRGQVSKIVSGAFFPECNP